MYGRKKKDKPVKQMKAEKCNTCGDTQHKVPQAVADHKKVKPKEVFGSNYKANDNSKKVEPKPKPKVKVKKTKNKL